MCSRKPMALSCATFDRRADADGDSPERGIRDCLCLCRLIIDRCRLRVRLVVSGFCLNSSGNGNSDAITSVGAELACANMEISRPAFDTRCCVGLVNLRVDLRMLSYPFVTAISGSHNAFLPIHPRSPLVVAVRSEDGSNNWQAHEHLTRLRVVVADRAARVFLGRVECPFRGSIGFSLQRACKSAVFPDSFFPTRHVMSSTFTGESRIDFEFRDAKVFEFHGTEQCAGCWLSLSSGRSRRALAGRL